ncbi:hypothetical protein [Spongiimicrobium sp. 3-5]|uniref:hypothetical protein n=1 Tax=Spongiimicrobium sp. 3-5 TaxID=3332596 RepID=UPI00397EE64D
MKKNKNIEKLVDEVLDSASTIDTLKSPPFFKERVFNKLARNEDVEEEDSLLGWFSIKYQVAVLLCFVTLNAFALFWYSAGSYDVNVDNFAEAYGLSNPNDETFYNLN